MKRLEKKVWKFLGFIRNKIMVYDLWYCNIILKGEFIVVYVYINN